MKKVCVVILNYKVKEETLKCIESVKKSDYQDIEIIIVDNNSGDGLEQNLKNISNVTFIQAGNNLGYAGGNNLGIKKVLEGVSDYIFILNPDAWVEKETVKNLVKAAENNNDAGIFGPKILFSDKKTIWYAGGIFDKDNVLGKHKGVDKNDSPEFNKVEETDYVTGGAMFVKREVFEKIGLFDERYFLYYEDTDFCLRTKKAGYKIFYVPSAVVFHENAKSTGLGTSLQDYFITRNRMLYASKFLPLRTRFALFREGINNIFIPARRLALFDFLGGNFKKGSFLK